IVGLAGVTAIDRRAAGPTVKVVAPVMVPLVAEMELVPWLAPWARPPPPIVATPVLDDAHVAGDVRSAVEPSLKVPVAWNWRSVPLGIDGLAGVTSMDRSTAAVTVIVVDPVTEPDAAEMELFPVFTAWAAPPLSMVATDVLDDA